MLDLFSPYGKLYADSGYQVPNVPEGLREVCRCVGVQIVKRSDAGKFAAMPKRWIVERTIGCKISI